MARGTFPQIFETFRHSDVPAAGSKFWTRHWDDTSSSSLILTAWCPWNRKFKNSQDSLVVSRKVTLLLWSRISAIKLMTSSFTFGMPLSNKSSALSRMKVQGSDISSKSEQSSSSADKRWSLWNVLDRRNKPRSLDVRSLFNVSPRSERKYNGRPCALRRCPTVIATDVLPNPGEPQTVTSRVASEVKCSRISLHSLSRPVKWGTIWERRDSGSRGLDSITRDKTSSSDWHKYRIKHLHSCQCYSNNLILYPSRF